MKNLKTKRRALIFLVTFFAFIISLGLSACNGDVVTIEPEEQDSYTVTFNTNGGNTIEPKTVAAGKKVTKPKKPVREGAIFEGWYSDSSLNDLYNFKTPVNSNLTLYAKWKILQTFTITFDSNGGTTVSPVSLYEGNIPQMPQDPTREGYTFKGWFTDSELTQAYSAVEIEADIMLYAAWELNVYTVTFNTAGGTAIASQRVAHGQKATFPAYPSRKNCSFNGWYTQKYTGTGDVQFDFYNTIITQDTTIYAGWIIEGYTVTFESNGGPEIITQVMARNGTEAAEEPEEPAKKGYEFKGWYTDAEFTTPYDFSTLVTQDIILYAKWQINTYTVAFIVDGGIYVQTEVDYKKKVSRPEDPQKTGYDFTGWYTEDGEAFDFRTSITKEYDLFADFERQFYNVAFVTNCDTQIETKVYGYGDNIINNTVLEKTGYSFEGWYTDEACSSENLFNSSMNLGNSVATGPLTLYAKWSPKIYEIKYITFTGGSSVDSAYVEYGQTFASLPDEDPTRGDNDYTFDGWYWDLSFTEPVSADNPRIIYDDCNIYAKWISKAPVSIRITLDNDNPDVVGSYSFDGKYYYLTISFEKFDNAHYGMSYEDWTIITPEGIINRADGYIDENGKHRYQFSKTGYLPGIYVFEWAGELDGKLYSYTWLVEIEREE